MTTFYVFGFFDGRRPHCDCGCGGDTYPLPDVAAYVTEDIDAVGSHAGSFCGDRSCPIFWDTDLDGFELGEAVDCNTYPDAPNIGDWTNW